MYSTCNCHPLLFVRLGIALAGKCYTLYIYGILKQFSYCQYCQYCQCTSCAMYVHIYQSTIHIHVLLLYKAVACDNYFLSSSSDTVISSTTSTPHTAYTSSLPSPPPGFVAKPAFATTSVTSATRPAVTKVATPTTVHGAVGGGTLSSSVNHALWANSQMQGKGVYSCIAPSGCVRVV